MVVTCCGPRRQPEVAPGPVPVNGFVKHWGASLQLDRDPADRLVLREDLVFMYTRGKRAFVLSAAGGDLLASSQITSPGGDVRPPVLMGERIVYPTLATLEVYDRRGRHLSSVPLQRPNRGPAVADQNFLYFGVDHAAGGRLVKMDLSREYGRTIWELMTFGAISAAPAVYQDGIYAASEDGRVYAIDAERDPIWALEGNTFRTDGPIVADVQADEFGVYVASTDSKLYCLDRLSGRIKWTYLAGVGLRTSPIVLADRVYQVVPGRGLVAINKIEGQPMRQPLWVAPDARAFLSADSVNVYVLGRDGSIIALDRNDGQPRFRSQRRDLTITAANTRDSTIYACTRQGEVLAIRPVLTPGVIGQIVFDERVLDEPLARLSQTP
jgi:hypothetical protein